MKSAEEHNYRADVLKLLCAILVFFCHSGFMGADISFISSEYFDHLGWIGVHFFFMISGFLMVKSLMKKEYGKEEAGKSALNFVLNKFKRILLPYLVAGLMMLFMQYIYIYICTKQNPASMTVQENVIMGFFDKTVRVIPELLGVCESGILFLNNVTVWYISAMLLVMLPMSYMYITKKDFFVYVFSPTAALFTFGYIFRQESNGLFMPHSKWYSICLGGVIRAVCGIAFGVVAWIIYEKLHDMADHKRTKILLTGMDLLLNALFFYTWLFRESSKETLFSAMLLMPFLLALIFSKKSCLNSLFCFSWMRYAGTLSLTIYFNHYAAICIVLAFFKGRSYGICLLVAILLTALFCVINTVIVKTIKKIGKYLQE